MALLRDGRRRGVMDGLDKTNCAFSQDGTCNLTADACKTCKIDKCTSDFHKTLVVGGLSWDEVVSLQQRKEA